MSTTPAQLLQMNREERRFPLHAAPQLMSGFPGLDAVNSSAPFHDQGEICMAVQLQPRASQASVVEFVRRIEIKDTWTRASLPQLALTSPWCANVPGGLLVGGTVPESARADAGRVQVFTRAGGAWEHVATLPNGVTSIRLIPVPRTGLVAFIHHDAVGDGPGHLSTTVIDDIGGLTAEALSHAELLPGLFDAGESVTVSDAIPLGGSTLGILGQVAFTDDQGGACSYPLSFQLDLDKPRWHNPRVLFDRSDLPRGPEKRADLHEIIRCGGIDRDEADRDEDNLTLFCSAGSAEVFRVQVRWPFD